MNTHVVILAQGTQKRMGDFVRPKQLLGLAAHQAAQAPNTTILGRTVMQVVKILGQRHSTIVNHCVEVVARPEVGAQLPIVLFPETPDEDGIITYTPMCTTLPDPGNSSIKGAMRFFTRPEAHFAPKPGATWERTVVLLGDVLYSWACLYALFQRRFTFAGSSDLGRDRGELWGVSWCDDATSIMAQALADGLAASSKHEDEYQPGQLRHWLWAIDASQKWGADRRPWWVAIDDYTMDVDLPEHLPKLAAASLLALADDKEHGAYR